MPIDSIANLRHLSQARGSFVRLEQGTDRLQTTTVRARFWQWSQRSQEKAGNRAAAERVRDSVCAYCGKAEGTRLFNQYIGRKSLEGRAFTGANLSRLLDAAVERNLACLGRGMVATGRRALRPELMAELGRAGVDPDYFVSLVSRGVRLVGNDSWGQQSVAEAERELASVSWAVDAMRGDLDTFQASLPPGAEGVAGVLHCLEGLKAQLDTKRDIMAAQKAQSPFTAGNVRLAFRQIYAACERVIGEHVHQTDKELGSLDPASGTGMRLAEWARDLNRLMAAMQDKMADPPGLRGLADGERVSDAVMETFNALPGELGKELHRLLPDLSAGKLAKAIKEAHIQVLNEQDWGVIRRDLQYLGRGGAGVTATSTITPARHIGAVGGPPGPIGREMAGQGAVSPLPARRHQRRLLRGQGPARSCPEPGPHGDSRGRRHPVPGHPARHQQRLFHQGSRGQKGGQRHPRQRDLRGGPAKLPEAGGRPAQAGGGCRCRHRPAPALHQPGHARCAARDLRHVGKDLSGRAVRLVEGCLRA